MPDRAGIVTFSLPLIYKHYFLFIEPACTVAGAYLAHSSPKTYLELMHAASASPQVPIGTVVAVSQLAGAYVVLALLEALVLRCTGDMRVWRTVVSCLLVGDAGHLWAFRGLGLPVYWRYWEWNAAGASIPFVYLGTCLRIAFLAGVGFGAGGAASGGRRPGVKAR